MRKNDNTSFWAAVIVIGIILFIGWVMVSLEPKCAAAGCDYDCAEDSSYCYFHKRYGVSYGTSYGNYGSSTRKSGSSSDTKPSGNSSNSTNNSKKYYSGSSSYSSYDDGYDAIYEDDDYDWDRYYSDPDYADGVDDAMDDLEW